MKKKYLLFFIISVLSFLVSCKKDKELNVNMVVSVEVSAKSEVKFYLDETKEELIKKFVGKVVYSSGEKKLLTITKDMLKKYNNTILGNQNFEFLIENKIIKLKVNIEEPATTNLIINTPSKIIYFEGEKLDLSGLKVTANLSNGKSKDVTEGVSLLPASTALLKVTDAKVEVTYGGVTKAFNIIVKPVELTELVLTPPTKVNYFEGEKLDLSGLKVIANLSNGTSKDVTTEVILSSVVRTGLNISNTKIEVSYGGVTKVFNISVIQ